MNEKNQTHLLYILCIYFNTIGKRARIILITIEPLESEREMGDRKELNFPNTYTYNLKLYTLYTHPYPHHNNYSHYVLITINSLSI